MANHVAESQAAAPKGDASGVRVPPFFHYVAAFLAGVAVELILPMSWPPPDVRIAVALLAGVAWLALDIGAIGLFGRAGTTIWPNWPMNPTTTLVTSGPYRLSRNPQYVGIACLYIALAFAVGVMWALALLPVVLLAVDRFVIAREEQYLEAKFGQDYRDYKARVRRWL